MDHDRLHRFEEYGALLPSERRAVLLLGEGPYDVRRGGIIRREAVEVKGFYILLAGWAYAASTLDDGRQQIMKIHLPGDALGTPSMAMTRTTEELCAVTDVTVSHVPLARFGQLFVDHPRIVARFLLSIQLERIALMDRLVSIGRTSAKARLAAFLLDIRDRLRLISPAVDRDFDLPLLQEQVADVLGLTNVHVNRMFAELTKANLIKRSGKKLHLYDIAALEELADRPERTPYADQAWMPIGR